MRGVKIAAFVISTTIVIGALLLLLVAGMIVWLGSLWGGIASLVITLVGMFILIAVVENRS